AGLTHIQIHLAGGVGEHAVTEHTRGHLPDIGFIVVAAQPDQQQQAAADLAHCVAPDHDPRLTDPLQQHLHDSPSATSVCAAVTSARSSDGSLAEWPASGTICSRAAGQCCCNSTA